jgi:hypothetical protein
MDNGFGQKMQGDMVGVAPTSPRMSGSMMGQCSIVVFPQIVQEFMR